MGVPKMTVPVLSILSTMLEEPEEERYGLELAARAALTTGTIYPALARLEQAGWLSSRWEDVDPGLAGRPRRRLYRLTGEGVLAATWGVEQHARRLALATGKSTRRRLPGIQPT